MEENVRASQSGRKLAEKMLLAEAAKSGGFTPW